MLHHSGFKGAEKNWTDWRWLKHTMTQLLMIYSSYCAVGLRPAYTMGVDCLKQSPLNSVLRVRKPSPLVWFLLRDQYLRFDLVVSEAEVLEVGSSIGLDWWELMLQHLDHLWQLWIPPAKLPTETHMEKTQHVLVCEEIEISVCVCACVCVCVCACERQSSLSL